jgi:hypothetical protein
MINVGAWGGIYCRNNRLCLGWVAFTFFPFDIDPLLERLTKEEGKKP